MAYNAPAPLSSPLWAVQQLHNTNTGGNVENSTSTITKRRLDDDFSSTALSKSAGKFVCQLCGSHQNPNNAKKSPFSFGSFGSSSSFRGASNNASRRQLSACPACDQKVCPSCRHEAAVMPPMRDFAVEMLAATSSSNSTFHHPSAIQQQHSRERRICKAIVAKKWICWACAKQLQLRLTTGFGGWLSDQQQQPQKQQQQQPNGAVLRNYSFSSSSTAQTLPPHPPATAAAGTANSSCVMMHKKQQRSIIDTINSNNVTASSSNNFSSGNGDASSTLTDGTFRRRQLSGRSGSGNQALQQQSQQDVKLAAVTTHDDREKAAQSQSTRTFLQPQQATTTLTKSKTKKIIADESDKTNMPLSTLARNQLGKSHREQRSDKVELPKPDYDLSTSSSEVQRHSTQPTEVSSVLPQQATHSHAGYPPELQQTSLHNRTNSSRFKNRRQHQIQQSPQQRDPSPFRHVADGRGNLASPGFSRRTHHAEQILIDSVSSKNKFDRNRQELSIPSSLSRFVDQTNALKRQQQQQQQQKGSAHQQLPPEDSLSSTVTPPSFSLSQQAMQKLTAITGGAQRENLVSSSSSLPPPAVPSRRRHANDNNVDVVAVRQANLTARSPVTTTSSISHTASNANEDDKISYYSSTSLTSSLSDSVDKSSNFGEQQQNMLRPHYNSNQIFPQHTSFGQLPKSNRVPPLPLPNSSSSSLDHAPNNDADKRRTNKFSNKLFKHFTQSASLEDTTANSNKHLDYNTMTLVPSVSHHHHQRPIRDDLQTEDEDRNRSMTLDRAFLALRARSKQPSTAVTSASTAESPSATSNSKVPSNMLHAFFNSLTRNSGCKNNRAKGDVKNVVENDTAEFQLPLPRPPLQVNRFASLPRMPKKVAQARSRAPLVLSAESPFVAASLLPTAVPPKLVRSNDGIFGRDAVVQEYAAYVNTWQEIEQIQAEWFDAEVRMEDAEREFGRAEREFDEFLQPHLATIDGESSISTHSDENYARHVQQMKSTSSKFGSFDEPKLPSPSTITYESDCLVTVTVPAVKQNNFQAKYKTYNPRHAVKNATLTSTARSDDDEKAISVDGRIIEAIRAHIFNSDGKDNLAPFKRGELTSRSPSNSSKSSAATGDGGTSAAKTHVCRIVVEDTITPTLRLSRQSSLCHTSSSSAKSVSSPSASASSVCSTSPRSSARGEEKFSYPTTMTTTRLTTTELQDASSTSALMGNTDVKTTITIGANTSSKTLPRTSSEAIEPTATKIASLSSATSAAPLAVTGDVVQRRQHVAAMVERILRGEPPTFTVPPKPTPASPSLSSKTSEQDANANDTPISSANSSLNSPRPRFDLVNNSGGRSASPAVALAEEVSQQQSRQLSSSPPSKPGGDDDVNSGSNSGKTGTDRASQRSRRSSSRNAVETNGGEFSDDDSLSSSDSSLMLSDVAPESLRSTKTSAAADKKAALSDATLDQLFAPEASTKPKFAATRPSVFETEAFSASTALPATVVTDVLLLHDEQQQIANSPLAEPRQARPHSDTEEEDEQTDGFDDDDDEDGFSAIASDQQQQPVIPPRQCRKAPATFAQRENDTHGRSGSLLYGNNFSEENCAIASEDSEDSAAAAMLYAAMRLTHNDLHRLLTPIPEEEYDDDDQDEHRENDPFCDVNLSGRKFSDKSAVASDIENDDDDGASTIIDDDDAPTPKMAQIQTARLDRNDSLIDDEDLQSEYSAVGSDFENDDDDEHFAAEKAFSSPKNGGGGRNKTSQVQQFDSDSNMSSLELYFLADLPANNTSLPKY